MERGVTFTIGDEDDERDKVCLTEVFNTTTKCTVIHRGTTSLTLINRLGKFTNMFPKLRSNRTYGSNKLVHIKG
jgi:hypothetical protein